MACAKILIVDDNASILVSLCKILELHDFEVTGAAGVSEALAYISATKFDVLLSDLHMPGAGDGFDVVSAMRNANPEAVTLLLSAFPEMSAVANAVLLHADEVLIKPMKIPDLIDAIMQRLAKGPLHKRRVETLATILERTTENSIDVWYSEVEKHTEPMAVGLTQRSV